MTMRLAPYEVAEFRRRPRWDRLLAFAGCGLVWACVAACLWLRHHGVHP